nr:hypothetical protein Iba_chr12bCG20860 [Ipomoea batatas]
MPTAGASDQTATAKEPRFWKESWTNCEATPKYLQLMLQHLHPLWLYLLRQEIAVLRPLGPVLGRKHPRDALPFPIGQSRTPKWRRSAFVNPDLRTCRLFCVNVASDGCVACKRLLTGQRLTRKRWLRTTHVYPPACAGHAKFRFVGESLYADYDEKTVLDISPPDLLRRGLVQLLQHPTVSGGRNLRVLLYRHSALSGESCLPIAAHLHGDNAR